MNSLEGDQRMNDESYSILNKLTKQTALERKFGIRNYLADMRTDLSSIIGAAKGKYMGGSIYSRMASEGRTFVGESREQERTAVGQATSMWGSVGATFGGVGAIRGQAAAGRAGGIASLYNDAYSQASSERSAARSALFNMLLNKEESAANLTMSNYSLTQERELAIKQLQSQEDSGMCSMVAVRFGCDSVQEKAMKIWEKMHIRMNRKHKVRRQVWRGLFKGYHKMAPRIATNHMAMRVMTPVVDRFVGYVLCDIAQHSKPMLAEYLSAWVIGALSTIGRAM
jgi:hypothetical protein